MSEGLEGAVAEALRDRGDGQVDVPALRMGSVRRARSLRRRRFGFVAAGLAAVLVGAGQVAIASLGGDAPPPGPLRIGVPPSGPGAPTVRQLPRADVPAAAVDPAAVGSDPAIIHFGLDSAALDPSSIFWNSYPGLEHAAIWNRTVDHFTIWYYLSPDRQTVVDAHQFGVSGDPEQPATVFDRPATVQRFPTAHGGDVDVWVLTWQPTDGLWARIVVQADSVDDVVPAAQALRLDESRRCSLPARLSAAPAGYTWTGCATSVGSAPTWEVGGIALVDSDGDTVNIQMGNISNAEPFVANRVVKGYPAQWTVGADGSRSLMVPIRDKFNLVLNQSAFSRYGPAHELIAEEEAVALVELTELADVTNPATWSERAVP